MSEDNSFGSGTGYGTGAPPPAPEPNRVNAEARIWWDFLAKRYWISFNFHQGFIDFIKASIPKRARRYDPASKAWNFGRAYLSAVEAEARKVFPNVIVEMEPRRERKPRAPRTEVVRDAKDDLILEFFYAVPFDAIKSAYRKAAMLAHPDRGGTTQEMEYLNGLWEQLEEKVIKAKRS